MPENPGMLALAKIDIVSSFLFLYITMKNNAFPMLVIILGPMVTFYLSFVGRQEALVRRSVALISALFSLPFAGFLAIAAVMLPASYAQSSYPDGRVLIVAGFILAIMLALMGALLGLILSQAHRLAEEAMPAYLNFLSAVLVFLVFLYPVYDAVKSYRQIPEYRAWALAWDERDAHIRQEKLAGESQIVALSLNAPGGMSELRIDPQDWVNGCMAMYYGVGSISASP